MSSDNKSDMNGLGPTDKIVDMGDLYGNPIENEKKPETKTEEKDLDFEDIELSEEEERLLKEKLERIRKSDPFIYRWEY